MYICIYYASNATEKCMYRPQIRYRLCHEKNLFPSELTENITSRLLFDLLNPSIPIPGGEESPKIAYLKKLTTTRCALVDLLFLVKRVGRKWINNTSTVQIMHCFYYVLLSVIMAVI